MEKDIDISKLSEPLNIKDLDFRVQSINKGWYAIILAYKDARVDMNRLDEVVWPLNWKKEYTRDNKNCIVSIYDKEKKEWISKEDTWTESFSEAEKWLASDSFKRACFNWWIWRELYEYPIIQVKLNDDEFNLGSDWKAKATYKLNIREWIWWWVYEEWKLKRLACKDKAWKVRFNYTLQES